MPANPALTTIATDHLTLTQKLQQAGDRLGFELVGIAPAAAPAGLSRFQDWLAQGYAGEMGYLSRRSDAYGHPEAVLEGVRSLVMVGLNYKSPLSPSTQLTTGRIAAYAQGGLDYHDVLKERLQRLADQLHAWVPGCRTRCVVDTAPLLERDFARLAGLGWFGKNTLLIRKGFGSFFFLGALLTDVELEIDTPHVTHHCGTCTRCLEACPTDAFPEPGVLDARRCISYLTIELKGTIPTELRAGMGNWLFGCDVCQDVCPWNRKSPVGTAPEFQPRPEFSTVDATEWLLASDADLKKAMRHTPLSRPGPVGLKRNAAIVLGNLGRPEAVPALAAGLEHADAIVQRACAWALGQLKTPEARAALIARLAVEDNPQVTDELQQALNCPEANPTTSPELTAD